MKTVTQRALPSLAIAGLLAGVVVGPIAVERAEAASLAPLSGAWRGGGRLNLKGGKSERLRCRAYYNQKSGGKGLGMAVRCASSSYKLELRAQLRAAGNRITGSWEERTFNASGELAGTLKPGRLVLNASGSIAASLTVSFSGSSQSVTLGGKFDNFRGISLKLRK